MDSQMFYLLGDISPAEKIEFNRTEDSEYVSWESLQNSVARKYGIVEPKGIVFFSASVQLSTVSDILNCDSAAAITVEGKSVRDIEWPKGLPWFGNYFAISPDHLGKHQRFFEKYGPIFRTTNLGRTTYHTNDPRLAQAVFTESGLFSNKIIKPHPLYPFEIPNAVMFLGDSNTTDWHTAHKFLAPALGSDAIHSYLPTMQQIVEDAFSVFDCFDEQGKAWNVYQYMLKLCSQAVGKLVLGIDFEHFSSANAPLHEMVGLVSKSLELNKRVTAWGGMWAKLSLDGLYARLPLGDPKQLRGVKRRIGEIIEESIKNAARNAVEDLPFKEAALQTSNMVGQ